MNELIYVNKTSDRGEGIFAARDILKDEVILRFEGPLVEIKNVEGIPREVWDHLFNVGVDKYIIAKEPAVRTNHSCEPNAGIVQDVLLVAMRNIKKDEEITFDYSIITADNWTMECKCGCPSCRKIIGNYKDLPDEVKRKYDKYASEWIKAL